jgi:hypothetical protein
MTRKKIMTKTIQIRGNCQCCGKEQAVVGGLMSKHGYTVEQGWFSGVCEGNFFKPMQVSRVETDNIVASIRIQIPKLLAQSEQYLSGALTPDYVVKRSYNAELRKNVEIKTPYADASVYEQESARKQIAWTLKSRADMGKTFSDQLEAIANKVHGTALIETEKKQVIQICVGDKKKSQETGLTYVCFKVEGARIWWTSARASDGKILKSWMGSQSWRKLETV